MVKVSEFAVRGIEGDLPGIQIVPEIQSVSFSSGHFGAFSEFKGPESEGCSSALSELRGSSLNRVVDGGMGVYHPAPKKTFGGFSLIF